MSCEPGQAQFSKAEFRAALGSFATGVTVVTTRDNDGKPVGLTVNSFASVSMDPPLVLWSLRRESPCVRAFSDSRHFAVNILAESQADLCRRFASPCEDRFAGLTTHDGIGAVPILDGASATLQCTRVAIHEGGDHLIFIGRVENLSADTTSHPLVYCRGSFVSGQTCGRTVNEASQCYD